MQHSSEVVTVRQRRTWVVALGCLTLAAWSAPRTPRLVQQVSGDDFPVALLAVAHLALLAVASWLAVVVLLDRAGGLPRHVARLLTPRWARGLLLASVGALAVVTPAQADPGSLDGLRLPDRPAVSSSASAVSHAPRHVTPERRTHDVAVRSGDTLWSIAARHLGPHADVAEVASAVQRWHHANRHVIGADPDVLLPGQVLSAPEGASS